jgi:hypothetical protein
MVDQQQNTKQPLNPSLVQPQTDEKQADMDESLPQIDMENE